MRTIGNIAQVDQSNIRKLVIRRAFLKGLTLENQLAMEKSGDLFDFIERKKETNLITTCKHAGSRSYNTAISLDRIVPVITEEDVKHLGLKIDQISLEK